MNEIQSGALWRKSVRSNPSGNCVEVAALPDGRVAVRDSKDPGGAVLVYTRCEVIAFVGAVKAGRVLKGR